MGVARAVGRVAAPAKVSTLTADVSQLSIAEIHSRLSKAAYTEALLKSREGLLAFTQFMMPDPDADDDVTKSVYEVEKHHQLIAEAFERVARGECLRLALSIPPQFGKSELLTRKGIAWFMGKFPNRATMFGTYNQDRANEEGDEVRTLMQSPRYAEVFPKTKFRPGSKAKDHMVTSRGGQMAFIGRGGSGTGKPADLIVLDDPLKNSEEADSPTIRKQLHNWFTKVIYSRAKTLTAIVIVHTRWTEDDLIGRYCDPDHPDYDAVQAEKWTYINVPAVLKPGPVAEALGAKLEISTIPSVRAAFGQGPVASLWPSRFSLEHLASAAKIDPVGFNALYMGRPTPEDGEYFKADWIDAAAYDREQLPKNLRKYGASDHAVTDKTVNDPSVIGCIGIDEQDDIWVLPDLVWERMETDRIVDELIGQMQTHKPYMWWLEDENISKAFGPFLFKEMKAKKVNCLIDPIIPSRDMRTRARSIQGSMSHKRVHLPRQAPWFRDARAELLKFPFATHDDFVAFMALIGLGLMKEIRADPGSKNDNVIKVGSLAWIKAASSRERQADELKKKLAGW